jgi:hypothetical protein
MVGSKSGSGALFLSDDNISDFEMRNGFWKMKESLSGNISLFETCAAIGFLVAEVTTAADIVVWVRFGEMASVFFEFGIASGYSLLVVLVDGG